MRLVTVAAVFRDGLVFPEKWPAIFRMAARAGFVDGILHELRRRRRPVRRMAGSAGHLAFAQRMVRRLKKICVLCLMTGGADLDLGDGAKHWIFGCVQRVAACAYEVARGVGARRPIMCRVRLVAA